MITEAELTGCGIRAMSDRGEVTLSFAYGAGYASLLVTHTGQQPFEVPLSTDALHHLEGVVARACNCANLARDTEYADRLVPRHAAKG